MAQELHLLTHRVRFADGRWSREDPAEVGGGVTVEVAEGTHTADVT